MYSVPEGYGADVIGGADGRPIFVTNLNDAGPGSFREAVLIPEPRTIQFAVSGTVELKSRVEILNGFLTIDGSNAPQGGICIKGETVKLQSADDTIVRHIRFRPGLEGTSDSLIITGSEKIMIDHCSLSWAVDEILSISDSKDVTVQWCIISEALRAPGNSMGILITDGTDRITIHHNLIAHCRDRVPYIKCGIVDYRNNINYNSFVVGYCGSIDEPTYQINYIGNMRILGTEANKLWGFKILTDGVDPDLFLTGKVYLEGNIDGRRIDNTLDENLCLDNYPVIPDQIIADEINMPLVRTTDAFKAKQEVLQYAGAILPRRDAVDQRIINDVKLEIGSSINDPSQVGGWPDLTIELLLEEQSQRAISPWLYGRPEQDGDEYVEIDGLSIRPWTE